VKIVTRIVLFVVGSALAVMLPTSLFGQKADPLEPVHRMEHRYRAAKTLQATFLERYTESGRTVRIESGTAYFRRPGKMRWEYEAPEKDLFLVDGKFAWFYVPADHTVTRVPAKQSSDWRTPLALLAGEAKVSRVCARVEPARDEQPEAVANAVFRCILRGEKPDTPKSSQPSASKSSIAASSSASSNRSYDTSGESNGSDVVLLEVVRDSGELVRILVRNPGGSALEFHFAQWRDDPLIAEALFHFEPPPGVAIVNGELPDAANPPGR
jgi:outer membrane lipoprotein-sorting protein